MYSFDPETLDCVGHRVSSQFSARPSICLDTEGPVLNSVVDEPRYYKFCLLTVVSTNIRESYICSYRRLDGRVVVVDIRGGERLMT